MTSYLKRQLSEAKSFLQGGIRSSQTPGYLNLDVCKTVNDTHTHVGEPTQCKILFIRLFSILFFIYLTNKLF